ncbi:MAG: hypothetical protein WCX82_01645 [archaeon]|jgi:hypothetical protein
MHRHANIRRPPINPEIKLIRHRVTNEKFDASHFPSSFISELKIRKDNSGQPIKLGGGYFGEILLGDVIFKNGSKQRVAIKKFIPYDKKLIITDSDAMKYQYFIDRLRKIELEHDSVFPNRQIGKAKMIPKTAMVKIQEGERDPEWVIVSQAFVKDGKSKFKENNDVTIDKFNSSEYTWTILKLGDAGFITETSLNFLSDLFTQHKDGSLLPMDLDFARTIDFKKRDRDTRANDILNALALHVDYVYKKDKDKRNAQYIKLVLELLKHKMDLKLKDLLIQHRKKYLIK